MRRTATRWAASSASTRSPRGISSRRRFTAPRRWPRWRTAGWSSFVPEEVFFRLVNVPPSLLDDTAVTNEDTPVDIPVLANDVVPGTSQITVGNGAHGTAVINNNGTTGDATDDYVVYTPAAGFVGNDSFT